MENIITNNTKYKVFFVIGPLLLMINIVFLTDWSKPAVARSIAFVDRCCCMVERLLRAQVDSGIDSICSFTSFYHYEKPAEEPAVSFLCPCESSGRRSRDYRIL